MVRSILLVGAIGGFIGVMLRAMAAHVFNNRLTAEMLITLKTAIDFQLLHSLVLILIALLMMQKPNVKSFPVAGWAIITGIFFFSGSLYIKVFTEIEGLGFITPAGGLSFLIGWGFLTIGAWNINND